MAVTKENLFEKSVFEHSFNNIPIPSLLDSNSKALAEAAGTNSVLYTLTNYKASKSSQIVPLIVKEKASEKALAREYKREHNKFAGQTTDSYVIKGLQELRTKAFEEIPLSEIQSGHELYSLKKLLTKPNGYQRWSEFVYAYSFFKDNGWAAMWGNRSEVGANKGAYLDLYQLPTHLLEIIAGTPSEPISGYRFKTKYKEVFKAEDTIRLSSFSPSYDSNGGHLYGRSKIKAAWDEFQTYAKATERAYSSFSGADLKAILMPEAEPFDMSSATDESSWFQSFRDRMLRSWKQKGDQRIAIVGHPVKAIQFQNEIKNQIIAEAQETAMNNACAVWSLDRGVVFPSEKGTTFENQKDMIAKTLRNGVFPDLRILEEAFREDIIADRYGKHTVVFDYDVYPELTKDLSKEMEMLTKADFLTDNEKRKYIDYEGIEDEKAKIPRAYWNELAPLNPLPTDGDKL